MYMNKVGNSITIALDSQEEANALLATLAGYQQPTKEADEFGKRVYTFFFQSVHKLATNFSKEVEGHTILFPKSADQYRDPRKGYRGSL